MAKLKRKKVVKANKNWYFNNAVEEAIIEYNNSTCPVERNKIFATRIYRAFKELVENLMLVHRIKCSLETHDSVRDECVSHLCCALNRFDVTRGAKAFSYYDVIAKHWLINFARKQQTQLNTETELDNNVVGNIPDEKEEFEIGTGDLTVLREQLTAIKESIKVGDSFFETERTRHGRNLWRTLAAVIHLLDTIDQIPTVNKKSIRAYIREISGLKSAQIAASLKSLKPIYERHMAKRRSQGDAT